jgi:hypothetical protein
MAENTIHRSWVYETRRRLVEKAVARQRGLVRGKISVGSDLHLLEMALAERTKLIEAVDALLRSTDYADDDRPLMRDVREALASAKGNG